MKNKQVKDLMVPISDDEPFMKMPACQKQLKLSKVKKGVTRRVPIGINLL